MTEACIEMIKNSVNACINILFMCYPCKSLMEIKGFSQCIAANCMIGLAAAASCGMVAACEFFVCKLDFSLLVAACLLQTVAACLLQTAAACLLQTAVACLLQLTASTRLHRFDICLLIL